MISGVRPFTYDFQSYPISVPSNWNFNGLYHPSGLADPIYTQTMFVKAYQLGQAWFAALAELRSLPSGHPLLNYNQNYGRGIIYVSSGSLSLPASIYQKIYEPDPSGNCFVDLGGAYSGISAQISDDTFTLYIDDLRNFHNKIFQALANDHSSSTSGILKSEHLKAFFPKNDGNYTFNTHTGLYTINLAEVQYNPYPMIAGDADLYLDILSSNKLWNSYLGGGSTGSEIYDPIDYKNVNFLLNSFRYFANITASQHGTKKILGLQFIPDLGNNFRSSPFAELGNYYPTAYETFCVFAVLDSFGPVFPQCQSLNGELTAGGENASSWWGDGAVLGKPIGNYTLNNQSGIIYNNFTDSYNYPSGNNAIYNKIVEFVVHYIYGLDPTAPLTAYTESTDKTWHYDLYPIKYGYDPSDFIIGYMAWYKQDNKDSVRVDGYGLIPGTRFRIIDLKDRTFEGWSSCGDYIYYASNNTITQSGGREVHSSVYSRNYNYGVNWNRYAAHIFGFPSHSGEPVYYVNQGIDPQSVGISGLDSIKDRRVWFGMPDTSNYDESKNEQSFELVTPIFAERKNVKKVCVEFDTTYNNGVISSGVGVSGSFSIWPSNDVFQNGSGIGYHVMDKGIWIRKGAQSCGLQLISPYNGQRLLFKKAEDDEISFGEEYGLWRKEVRPSSPYHYPEFYYGYNITRRTHYFLNPETDPFCQIPGSHLEHGTFLQEFNGYRKYLVSWYRSAEEQAPHTDGTYTIFNIAAEAPSSSRISRMNYLGRGDNPEITEISDIWFDHDYYDPSPYYERPDVAVSYLTYPIPTGYFDAVIGANGQGYPGGYSGTPDIPFEHPHFKYSPLLTQADKIGTYIAYQSDGSYQNNPNLPDILRKEGYIKCNVDIYIARKPYCKWDIPGLKVQQYGVSRIIIDDDFLENLLYEGLRPGYTLSQYSYYYYAEPDWLLKDYEFKGFSGKKIAFDGFLVLKLEMYGLQEGRKGGMIEGWGRLVETASAGITEEINPFKEWFDWEYSYHPYANTTSRRWNHDTMGWNSVPSFKPDSDAFNGYSQGSRFFRVWFDPNDPSEIHCVDDIWESKRHGLIVDDKIYRYHIADKNGNLLYNIYSTREQEYFLDSDEFDDYKNAKKCIKSITWIDDEMIAAAEMYGNANTWSSNYNNGRSFEIATLDALGTYDNDRARMIIKEPGRQWAKQRPGVWDPMAYPFDPRWTYYDPYMHKHRGYDLWTGHPRGFYEDLGVDSHGNWWYWFLNATVSAWNSEMADMWPRIVYANIY